MCALLYIVNRLIKEIGLRTLQIADTTDVEIFHVRTVVASSPMYNINNRKSVEIFVRTAN